MIRWYHTILFLCVSTSLFGAQDEKSLVLSNDNVTALFGASATGNVIALTNLLVMKKVNPNVRDGLGNTPLHYAKDLATVRLLAQYGADVNARNNDGVTRLAMDVVRGRMLLVQFLLEHGADANLGDKEGVMPLHLATMISYFSNPKSGLVLGAVAGTVGFIALTAAQVAAVGGAFFTGAVAAGGLTLTAPAATAVAGSVAALTLLAAEIVAIDIQIRNTIVKMLLKHGALPNSKDVDGNTPSHILASGSPFDEDDRYAGVIMAEQLVGAGADRTIRNKVRNNHYPKGQTAYDLAKLNNRFLLLPVLNPTLPNLGQKIGDAVTSIQEDLFE